ncbi:MarR family transcriptional regulator [Sphingomonas sp. JC676]|uniref:MarR family transcriptional regulator n=1 Tax=Sphingomonas sp. JC676 TaxID=2768065 RepID=UPI001657674F|nr:MarR family transcriptional regulator [Sphingomonas sp. JC676]MBC9033480.1 MarR family transcriptional regulator [Sphingomonas sp. JC676]
MGEEVALTPDQISRLRELVETTADRLGTTPDAAIAFVETAATDVGGNKTPHTLAQFAARWRALRMRRNEALGIPVFRDPAWDMLLDLLVASEEGRRVSVTSLCHASGVPTTTALRHVERLDELGLIDRTADPSDKRRFWVTARPDTLRRVRELVARLRAVI